MRIERAFAVLMLCCVAFGMVGCGSSHHLIDQGGEHNVSPLVTGSTSGPPKVRASGNRNGAVGRSQDEAFSGLEQYGTGDFTNRGGFSNVAVADKTPTGADGITLNLLNVPLAQAAKSILGDILKVNYTIADKLGGTVTIQTSAPMHKDAVVQVFESALRMNGAALVRGPDGSYRIVPSANAAQGGARFADARPSGPGTQIRVVALKYVSPSEMRRIIEPIAPQGAVVSVDDSRNLLVLAAGAREIADIDRLIGTFDVDWMRGMSVAFFPVKSSDPESISKELEAVMGLDKDGPLRGTVRILPNRRLNSIMVISSRPGPLDTARKWIQQLDRVAETSEEQVFVYKTRNRSAVELANLLGKVASSKDNSQAGATGSVAPRLEAATQSNDPLAQSATAASRTTGVTAGIVQPQTAAGNATGTGIAVSSPLGTAAVGSTQSIPPGTSELDRTAFAPAATPTQTTGRQQRIVADEANSALVITATRREYDRMLQILERLDTIPTQVMLEAVIAEVSLNDELKFGVKWKFGGKNGSRTSGTLSDRDTGAIASNFPGFSYFYLADNVSAAIDALSAITKVNVVSAPSLMVLDNRKAALQIGDQVPIVTQTAVNTVVTGGPIVNSVTLKDTGIILNVTPHVSDGGRVVLDIEQEASSVIKTTTSGIDSPTIQQRRIRTTVVVGDNEVVALGGLIQERDTVTKNGVPIISDVPVVGSLFRQKSDKADRTELLIFIRPQVVRNIGDAREVTDEFRRRIHLETPTTTRGRDRYDRDAQRIFR